MKKLFMLALFAIGSQANAITIQEWYNAYYSNNDTEQLKAAYLFVGVADSLRWAGTVCAPETYTYGEAMAAVSGEIVRRKAQKSQEDFVLPIVVVLMEKFPCAKPKKSDYSL